MKILAACAAAMLLSSCDYIEQLEIGTEGLAEITVTLEISREEVPQLFANPDPTWWTELRSSYETDRTQTLIDLLALEGSEEDQALVDRIALDFNDNTLRATYLEGITNIFEYDDWPILAPLLTGAEIERGDNGLVIVDVDVTSNARGFLSDWFAIDDPFSPSGDSGNLDGSAMSAVVIIGAVEVFSDTWELGSPPADGISVEAHPQLPNSPWIWVIGFAFLFLTGVALAITVRRARRSVVDGAVGE